MHLKTYCRPIIGDLLVRLFLVAIYLVFQTLPPFTRVLQPEELWLYNYPLTESYIPMHTLWVLSAFIPSLVVLLHFACCGNRDEFVEAVKCFSLVVTLNAAVTNVLKVIVGRPRPDYLARCYPSGSRVGPCRGLEALVWDGRKSFPSGHSSTAFSAFGFMSFYLAGKLRVFSHSHGEHKAVRLLAVLTPLFFSLCVAISRTCDYHHHWQDVTVGSALGLGINWLCYFIYFPPLTSQQCQLANTQIDREKQNHTDTLARVKEI